MFFFIKRAFSGTKLIKKKQKCRFTCLFKIFVVPLSVNLKFKEFTYINEST